MVHCYQKCLHCFCANTHQPVSSPSCFPALRSRLSPLSKIYDRWPNSSADSMPVASLREESSYLACRLRRWWIRVLQYLSILNQVGKLMKDLYWSGACERAPLWLDRRVLLHQYLPPSNPQLGHRDSTSIHISAGALHLSPVSSQFVPYPPSTLAFTSHERLFLSSPFWNSEM